MTTGEPTIVDNPAARRYELFVDGELAGFSEYKRLPDGLAFTHTVVQPEYGGRGLGTALARAVLDGSRAAGEAVLPFCPFIKEYIRRHPEYLDLVPAGRRAQFELA
jgi:uncharacterized protein